MTTETTEAGYFQWPFEGGIREEIFTPYEGSRVVATSTRRTMPERSLHSRLRTDKIWVLETEPTARSCEQ